MTRSSRPANATDPDALDGRILTFYSYKGGTGRSMLMANVAWLLASQGKSVLAIDWDLEAPGLHRYFYPFLEDKELAWSDGVINFVEDYKARAMTPPAEGETLASDWYVQHADIRNYAVSLNWDFKGGRLDFVPAGKQDATYSELVASFNWEDFYKRLGGARFLDAAVALMRRNYDYVLIDSRTGVSDTSGICTVKMPDALVVMFTLNYQSINGAAAVADYVYQQRVASVPEGSTDGKPRFNIFPIPCRLEDAQTRKMERRREYARVKKFARYPIYIHGGVVARSTGRVSLFGITRFMRTRNCWPPSARRRTTSTPSWPPRRELPPIWWTASSTCRYRFRNRGARRSCGPTKGRPTRRRLPAPKRRLGRRRKPRSPDLAGISRTRPAACSCG